MNPWNIVGAVAAVVVPVSTVLWLLIRTEMRAQILAIQLVFGERCNGIDRRVAVIESRETLATARHMRTI